MQSWRPLLLVVSAAAIACAANVDPATLLSSVRSKIRENAGSMPRYVCRQRIERKDFAYLVAPWIVSVHKQAGCGTLPEQGHPKASILRLASTDRARLDVMLAGGQELFSWPGGRSFGTQDPNDLLGGGLSGSGDFANFLISVFVSDNVTFEFLGACSGAGCARYRYDVPLDSSGYLVKSPLNVVRRLGFHGTFDVDPQSANLLRMSVIATDPSNAVGSLRHLYTHGLCENRHRRARVFDTGVNRDGIPV